MDTIDVVLETYPELTDFGFGRLNGFGEPLTKEEFEKQRADLRKSVERVEAARAWIRARLTPRKTFNPHSDSYCLKHRIERDIGYITNGVCIVAMLLEGYRARLYPPNCIFNIRAKFKPNDGGEGAEARRREGGMT